VLKKREKVNMRYSCRAVVGHGQVCEPNYQCDACAAKQKYIPRIEQLEAALREIIQEDALTGKTVFVGDFGKIARKALEGKDD
jgi:hypothetical protein